MVEATRARTELNVAPREVLGKKVKTLRRQGLTPANIYGQRLDSRAVQVPTDELKHVIKTAGRNDIVYLRLDGDEPRPTFIRDIQQNPITDAILHVDSLQLSLPEITRASIASAVPAPEAVTILTDVEQVIAKVAPPAVEPEPEVAEEEEA